LSEGDVVKALDRGWGEAERLRRRGLIAAAALFLNGEARMCGQHLGKTVRAKAFEGELVHG
jgi:hypothetical protein